MHVDINLFTLVMLVGPSRAGKTKFAAALTRALGAFEGVRVAHVSSDACRRMLAGDLPDNDPRLGEVSGSAFALLNAELEARMRWPVCTEVIVLDTTAMSESFRDSVRELAKKHQYRVDLVVFDYSHGDYLKGAGDDPVARRIVKEHAQRMKEEVLPTLKRRQYHRCSNIRKRSAAGWDDLTVGILDYALFRATRWSNEQTVALIGDVHEAVAPFEALLDKLPAGCLKLQLGDWIDKGGQVEAVIQTMERFVAAGGQILLGNHENYVAKRLRGTLEADPLLEESYFTSLRVLLNNPELAERFLALVAGAHPFVVFQGAGGRTVYVSHAPAPTKHLGKLDAESLAAQRNYHMVSETDEGLQAKLAALGPIGRNEPLHVFGHLAHQSHVFQNGRAFLDTGSVYGHELSALVLEPGRRPALVRVAGEKRADGRLYKLNPPMEKPADAFKVSQADQVFMDKFVASGARYLSGTIAPAPAMDGALESPAAALVTLRQHGVTRAIAEPKYMGSRAQVYLFRGEPERSFAITRKGFVVRAPEIQPVLEAVYSQFAAQDFWQSSLVLDGEMMPWRAIGGTLIDSEFERYEAGARAEVAALAADPVFQGFAVGAEHASAQRLEGLDTFQAQLALYGAEGEAHYKPFTVLAVDGECWLGKDQSEVFPLVAPGEPYLVIDVASPEATASLTAFFNTLTLDGQMEGMVLKPCVFEDQMTPALKVRNERYLHIIYGYDYRLRYASMCASKSIGRKLHLSRKEFFLGRAMLKAKDEASLRNALVQMRSELAQEATLDPRL